MSRRYETAILFDPELPEDQRKEFVSKLAGIIGTFGGEVLKQDDWGSRKLAYTIRKKQNAYYTFLVYTGKQGVVDEVERNIKIFDGVLRHLTTRSEGTARGKAAQPAQAGSETAAPEGPPPAPPA
ncbi:MAG: 30S ribosomal protein S6 [Deltaproteobacteria bacterium]|nr:30S ribosomal protein S6 [Deltaproteobacteria bacterium]